eukprot:TRINITY_DN24203_c0_g1_i2.p1 TRINITY_DN24203_c0_g1~~TRINITY_DN24203_c0_g1_i2.p1  ORF type:complete len:324 (+),score=29.58 TRINITY_DN24203_c0_g1_i2:56-1027(+)
MSIVPPCNALCSLAGRLAIGQYGGGDALQLDENLLTLDVPFTDQILAISDRARLVAAACAVHQAWLQQPADSRIWQYSGSEPAPQSPEAWEWSASLNLSSLSCGSVSGPHDIQERNAFFHAWLFGDELVAAPQTPGLQAWPLITILSRGLAESQGKSSSFAGCLFGGAPSSDDVRWAGSGVDNLVPSDQHMHQFSTADAIMGAAGDSLSAQERDELLLALGMETEMNIGSDMARFRVVFPRGPDACAAGDVVCVDVDRRRVHVAVCVLVPESARSALAADVAEAVNQPNILATLTTLVEQRITKVSDAQPQHPALVQLRRVSS